MSNYPLRLLRWTYETLTGADWDARFEPPVFEQTMDMPPRMMRIVLIGLPDSFRHRGVYGKSDSYLPERFRWGCPALVNALVKREEKYPGVFRMSDVYRSLGASLSALERGRAALPPSWSHHNVGGAVDDDTFGNRDRLREVGITEMGRKGWKRELDELNAAEFDLHCHRTDGRIRVEHWHHGIGLMPYYEGGRSFYRATQRWIRDRYQNFWRSMDWFQIQTALIRADFEPGPVDGIPGPKTRAAIRAFQEHWKLGPLRPWRQRTRRGKADENTRRMLAFASAEVVKTPWDEYVSDREPAPLPPAA